MKFPLNEYYVSIGIRGSQLVLSIIDLGLGAALVNIFAYDRPNFVLATSVLSFVYLIAILIPQVLGLMPLVAVVTLEFIFMVFWIASFGCVAAYGSEDCSFSGYYIEAFAQWSDYCKISKAAIAMGVLNFLLFLVSFVLMVMYSLVPSVQSKTMNATNQFLFGVIFLKSSTTPMVADEETGPVDSEDPVTAEESTGKPNRVSIDGDEKAESLAPESDLADNGQEVSGQEETKQA